MYIVYTASVRTEFQSPILRTHEKTCGISQHNPQIHTRANARGDSHSNNNDDVMQRFNSVFLHDGFVDDDRPE